ncbi:hypothetical protein LCGC14_1225660 [marine sediment metagenome]|uniref:Uncharacterized protein n=1 Tax=marine sediment metagenome TaxID=412755 RepID=A0A0F9LDZ0_9ZZZZ
MKVRDHISIIREQIKAMRADGHDKNTRISIQLDAIEYGTGAIIEAHHKSNNPEKS